MMESIIVLNRDLAASFQPSHPTAVISIRCPWDTEVQFNSLMPVLHLEFSDVSRDQYEKYHKKLTIKGQEIILFNSTMAAAILDFVELELDHLITHFMVHCAAGISRSPGVALALREIYMGQNDIPPKWVLYNTTVYQEIMKEHYRRLKSK